MLQSKLVIAVSGASGFIGQPLIAAIAATSNLVARAIYRTTPEILSPGEGIRIVGDLASPTNLVEALAGVDVVIHTAARAHVTYEHNAAPLDAYRRANVVGTQNVLRAAIEAGARRFVYLSSVGVNGKETPLDRPFSEADTPAPIGPYGTSKWEAEQLIWAMTTGTRTEAVILRPPLVYGPNVKGNLRRLVRLVSSGVPLPFGRVQNLRSMIGIDNLIDAILTLARHPGVAGRTFLVSDREDLSTPELVRVVAAELGRRAALWPVPVRAMELAAGLAGRRSDIERLTRSLRVDSSAIGRVTGWSPAESPREALRKMVASL